MQDLAGWANTGSGEEMFRNKHGFNLTGRAIKKLIISLQNNFIYIVHTNVIS